MKSNHIMQKNQLG
uniref:Uncharacterized protein n=1 Tax=Rhizophora mucronata TaxID=61149 RepID=A0A2P2NEL5_RHIMU